MGLMVQEALLANMMGGRTVEAARRASGQMRPALCARAAKQGLNQDLVGEYGWLYTDP